MKTSEVQASTRIVIMMLVLLLMMMMAVVGGQAGGEGEMREEEVTVSPPVPSPPPPLPLPRPSEERESLEEREEEEERDEEEEGVWEVLGEERRHPHHHHHRHHQHRPHHPATVEQDTPPITTTTAATRTSTTTTTTTSTSTTTHQQQHLKHSRVTPLKKTTNYDTKKGDESKRHEGHGTRRTSEETNREGPQHAFRNPTTPSQDTNLSILEGPRVLPVTEGKNRHQDPSMPLGLPKELMPIHPGGGSRFEDLEKEQLEKTKMAQTKEEEEDGDNASSSHDAEELYSAAPSLCVSSLILSFTSFRILL